MLYLRMYRATIPAESFVRLKNLKDALCQGLRPLLAPSLAIPAEVLGVGAEDLRALRRPQRRSLAMSAETAVDGELYTDGESLICVAVHAVQRSSGSLNRNRLLVDARVMTGPFRLEVNVLGPRDSSAEISVLNVIERTLDVRPTSYSYPSARFEELRAEGRESPAAPTEDEIRASQALAEKSTRVLAIAIKSSGGLLFKDIAKHLPSETKEAPGDVVARLKSARLVDSEIVVVCSKTQSQVTRAANRELVNELSVKGLKCACGRSMMDERIEEALTVTDLGRTLLDRARWLAILLMSELEAVGVSRESIFVEQTAGSDEIDCLVNVSGELVLFELKDKDFNLGNAYSFGAKIAIIKPQHPVIVTTEHVGNDAKDHFKRAGVSGVSESASFVESEVGDEIVYIEGVGNLRSGIEEIVSRIYRSDGIHLVNEVIPLGVLNGHSLIDALNNKRDRHPLATDAARVQTASHS